MIALTLVRVIERPSNQLAAELVTKLGISPRTAGLREVPLRELQRQIEEALRNLSARLLTKPAYDIERHYLELGERLASQGVALSDFCWTIAVTKERLGEFLERHGFTSGREPGAGIRPAPANQSYASKGENSGQCRSQSSAGENPVGIDDSDPDLAFIHIREHFSSQSLDMILCRGRFGHGTCTAAD
jgi:hypothetical protein